MDELAKKKAGINKSEGADKEPDAMAELEKAINQVDSEVARDLLRANARRLRANLELQAREAEDRVRRADGGGGSGSGNQDTQGEIMRDRIAANAITLLEKGVPANVVGQYLAGGFAREIPVNFGAPQGGQQGLTMADVKTIFDLAKSEKGTDSDLKEILHKMDDRLTRIEQAKPAEKPPRTWVVVQPDGTVKHIESDEPIVIQPQAPNTGKSVEQIKEENRHQERVEEIKNEKEYKQSIAGTLAELPERIGAGLGGRMLDAMEPAETATAKAVQSSTAKPAAASSSSMERIKCTAEGCGFDIPYPPEATKVTCPKCGSIYGREPS
jgi:predicted RNA-binding Zn-ribbon protein involved in translation (DUF1610 family)